MGYQLVVFHLVIDIPFVGFVVVDFAVSIFCRRLLLWSILRCLFFVIDFFEPTLHCALRRINLLSLLQERY